jgi:hypothetical protein
MAASSWRRRRDDAMDGMKMKDEMEVASRIPRRKYFQYQPLGRFGV